MAFNAFIEKLDKKLHEQNKITEYLEKAEKATGVRRLYIALGKILYVFPVFAFPHCYYYKLCSLTFILFCLAFF